MNRFLIITLLLIYCFTSFSQNLVKNSSFEQIKTCSLGGSGLDSAINWWQIGTADLFNSCSISPNYQAPYSPSYGYQIPFDGNGYAFFLNYAEFPATDRREYAQTKLSDSLLSGNKYHIAFRISFANNFKYASDGIGAFLSMDTVYGVGSGKIIDSIPQVQVANGIPISDTANWVLVQGSFIAKGGEKFLTIGNFKHDNQLTIQNIGGTASSGGYYLDGVCVSQDSLTCYNFVGIENHSTDNSTIIYPNPTNNLLHIKSDEVIIKTTLLTIDGKIVKQGSNSKTINVTDLTKGIYFIQIFTNNATITKKFVKN